MRGCDRRYARCLYFYFDCPLQPVGCEARQNKNLERGGYRKTPRVTHRHACPVGKLDDIFILTVLLATLAK